LKTKTGLQDFSITNKCFDWSLSQRAGLKNRRETIYFFERDVSTKNPFSVFSRCFQQSRFTMRPGPVRISAGLSVNPKREHDTLITEIIN